MDFAVELKKVRLLESFESEEIILGISGVVNGLLKSILILLDNLVNLFRDEGSLSTVLINVVSEVSNTLSEVFLCVFV